MVDRDIDEIEAQPREPLAHDGNAPRAGDVCYVIYTSGSTGRPKGVMIAHRNAVAFVKTLATVYKVTPHDRVYQGFSVAFDASVEEVWAAFAIGATLVVAPEDISRSPLDVADFITANEITYFSTVPTFLSLIERDLPTVRLLVLGGEACMPELVARWATPERRMLNTYGPTEATVVATWAECAAGRGRHHRPGTAGLPGLCARRAAQPGRPRQRGRAVHRRRRRRARLSQPARADGRALHRQSVQLSGGPARHPLPHPRHGAPYPRRPPAVPRPHRRPGEDPRLPRRAVRDRGGADGVPGRALGDRQRRHRRRPARGGGLHHRRRGRGSARPGRHRRDAAQPPARVHGAQVPRRRGEHADADQRQGRSQAAAGAGQSAEGHGSPVRRSGRRPRAGPRRGVGGVLPHLAGVGRGRLLPGPRRALPAGSPGGDRAQAPVRHVPRLRARHLQESYGADAGRAPARSRRLDRRDDRAGRRRQCPDRSRAGVRHRAGVGAVAVRRSAGHLRDGHLWPVRRPVRLWRADDGRRHGGERRPSTPRCGGRPCWASSTGRSCCCSASPSNGW